jgi:hypothetical protein
MKRGMKNKITIFYSSLGHNFLNLFVFLAWRQFVACRLQSGAVETVVNSVLDPTYLFMGNKYIGLTLVYSPPQPSPPAKK